ncbi:hypothetical protein [Streptomyces sp. NPDC058718]|uniref:hypothetical protein n=1 Tax=Streptomyces sp. NPDC058718 TaxID=3346610 RepID=UPI0036C1A27F
MEVNHAIKETGLSFNTDAVLAVPTKTSEVRLFELDDGTKSQARLGSAPSVPRLPGPPSSAPRPSPGVR